MRVEGEGLALSEGRLSAMSYPNLRGHRRHGLLIVDNAVFGSPGRNRAQAEPLGVHVHCGALAGYWRTGSPLNAIATFGGRMTLKNILGKPVAAGCTVGLILLAGVMYPQTSPQAPPAPRAVTDRELLEPDPADWLMWRRTLEQLGLQPAESDRQEQRRAAADGVDARHGAGHPGGDAAGLRRRHVPARIRATSSRPSTPRPAICSGSTSGSCPTISASSFPCRASTATWRSTATRSSTPAPTTSCSRSTRRPGSWPGRRGSSTIARRPPRRPRDRSSPTARSFSRRGCEPKCGPEACVITAHDAKTGKELWRTRTIPEARRARRRDLGRHSR